MPKLQQKCFVGTSGKANAFSALDCYNHIAHKTVQPNCIYKLYIYTSPFILILDEGNELLLNPYVDIL